MVNRFRQFIYYFFAKYTKEDESLIKSRTTQEEYNLFCQMSQYDKKHSAMVLRDLLNNDELKDNEVMIKLAILHDIGKPRKLSFVDRVIHVIFRSNQDLKNHPKEGAIKVGFLDIKSHEYKNELRTLILKHHDKNIKDREMILFQKIDDKY